MAADQTFSATVVTLTSPSAPSPVIPTSIVEVGFGVIDVYQTLAPGGGGGGSTRPSSGFLYPRGDN